MTVSQSTQKDMLLPKKKRLLSLDALRGFDMFWIISGEGIFHGLANGVMAEHALIRNPGDWTIATNGSLSFLERLLVGISNQLHHSPWNGFTFYDLIFPLFIFISGVSMPFSYEKHLNSGDDKKKSAKSIYYALIRRTLILIILGMVVNGILKWQGYESTRFASVLGRIALSTFFAALIYLNFSLKNQLIWFVGILAGYYILMIVVPVPGFGNGILTPEGNLAAYVDRLLLPGKLHRTVYDPEGLLSTIPAIATALLGVFTGSFLNSKSGRFTATKKAFSLLIAGILLISIGLIWNMFFPINKNMWTSSFVLVTGGFSVILLLLFYYIIDVKGLVKWSMPFIWIGTNSILIYVCAHGLFNFESTSTFLFGGLIANIPLAWQQAALWLGVLLIQLGILKFLYDRKWFLKV
ncbi:putative acyltransferase [Pedobacter sp. W3I1]|uniref:acyltransferase family protein n=1 Tax=Pedobacter sp. W3I1 TaxID=3042291 RepID=UPI00278B2EC0|nr:heparan-alpha-glucosaminide N-acetyltransferase domain-containing protein [Pedobacter sp. W3I1]MDQ0639685.1 putative acyltransferase [Pedobacter sp. W3I1]